MRLPPTIEKKMTATPPRIAIIVSRFNEELTSGLLAVVCLGCVIKGDTAHFEYISHATSSGLMAASLETGVPLAFGILTTYTEDQAIARSRSDAHNKGREAAAACLASVQGLRRISAA